MQEELLEFVELNMWDPEYPTLVYRNEWTTRLVLPQLQFIHEAITFKDSANQRNLSRSLYGNKTTDSIIVLYVLLCWPRTVWFLGTDLLAMRHLCVLASILVQVKLSAYILRTVLRGFGFSSRYIISSVERIFIYSYRIRYYFFLRNKSSSLLPPHQDDCTAFLW